MNNIHLSTGSPKCRFTGEVAQVAVIELEQGQSAWATAGALMSYTETLNWTVRLPGGATGAARRILAGENLAMTHISADNGPGHLVLAPPSPGKLAAWDLADGPVVATRGAFLGALGEIDISVTVARRAGAFFFGGAGVLLQTISGTGRVILHGSGDFIDYRLAERQTLLVSSGHLAAFAQTVDYDVRNVGGCRKMLLGGEGIFMTTLTGPGRVLLQTLRRGVRPQARVNLEG